jgi:hypothetical protein
MRNIGTYFDSIDDFARAIKKHPDSLGAQDYYFLDQLEQYADLMGVHPKDFTAEEISQARKLSPSRPGSMGYTPPQQPYPRLGQERVDMSKMPPVPPNTRISQQELDESMLNETGRTQDTPLERQYTPDEGDYYEATPEERERYGLPPRQQASDVREMVEDQVKSQRTIGEMGQGLYEGAKSALSFLPQSFDPERTGKTAVQLALGALATRLIGAPLAGTVLNAEQEAAIAGIPFGEMLTGYQPIERNAEALAIREKREAEEEALRLRNRQREEAMYAMQMRRAAMYDQLGAQALGSLMANYANTMNNSNASIQGYFR